MNIGPIKRDSGEYVLPANAFHQILNPFKRNGSISDFKASSRCVGTFWCSITNKFITLDLGPVTGQIIQKYRLKPSADMQRDLSRVEGFTSYFSDRNFFI